MTDETAGFEANRARLHAVAYRMLGSAAEADDAVQEAWLRLSRAEAPIDNLDAWLTTVVGRICLDVLRRHTHRREQALDEVVAAPGGLSPEEEAVRADTVGVALLVVLDTLTPAERLAFVLHDLFAVSFDEIAPIVGRSPDAARQLASRARRRVRTARPAGETAAPRKLIDAFLTAARGGDFAALLTMLDPDVEMRVDGTPGHRGSDAVARFFAGRAQAARPALIDGTLGIAVVLGGHPRYLLSLGLTGGRITTIDALADPVAIGEREVSVLG